MAGGTITTSVPRRIRTGRGATLGLALWFAGLAGVVIAPTAHAQSAGSWNKRGQDAEIREDYDAAYEDYMQGAPEEACRPALYGAGGSDALPGGGLSRGSRPRPAAERRH